MYKLNDTKYYYDEQDNIGILIDFTTGTYYSLNKLGTSLFKRFNSGSTKEDVINNLKEIQGCPDDIEKSVDEFIETLKKNEIIITDKANNSCEAFCKADVEDGFVPTAEEFTEAQDLIMADPVHDVNEEKGWPILK